jgi:8-oxo-dGTP diphosphatase
MRLSEGYEATMDQSGQQGAPEEAPLAAQALVGAIMLRDTAILLGKRASARAFYPGVWDVFGGHVEPQEAPAQALTRELQEELGITPLAFVEVAVTTLVVDVASGPEGLENGPAALREYEYHLYHVTEWAGTPENRLREEHSEIRWVPLEEAAKLELASGAYLPVFQRLAAGGPAPGS